MNIDIDAEQHAEDALRGSETRFRALAAVGCASFYRIGADWHAMHRLDGSSTLDDDDEPDAHWMENRIPPDERSRLRAAIDRAIAGRRAFALEHRVVRRDGSVAWVSLRAVPVLDDEDHLVEWFGTETDVKARVKADQAFSRLFEASPAPFLVIGTDTPRFTIREVDSAYLAATMRTRDDVVGRGIFETYPGHPEGRDAVGEQTLRASLDHVLASRRAECLPDLKYDIVRPDGTFEERWWSPINSPVLDQNGTVEAIIHNANDVTSAYRAKTALRHSEARLTAALESLPVGVAVIDLTGMVTLSNAAYRRFVPRDRLPSLDAAIRAHWRAFDADGRPIEAHDFPGARAMRGESVLPGREMLYQEASGREIRTNVASVPMFNRAGAVTGIVSMIGVIGCATRSDEA